MKTTNDYEIARRALNAHIKATREYMKSPETILISKEHEFGVGGFRCCLCRLEQKSSKSFSRRRDICLSCSMRGDVPRWVDISDAAIARWRGTTLTQAKLAELSGLHQPNIVRLEKQSKMNPTTARAIATGFVRAGGQGHSLRQLMADWPLFPLLVDHSVVNANVPDVEVLGQMGD